MHLNLECHVNALTAESPEDADGERGLFQLPQEIQSLLGPFHDP